MANIAGLWFKILAKKYMGWKMEVLLRIMCGGVDVLCVERGVSTRFDSLFSNYLLVEISYFGLNRGYMRNC